jgi:hypothetical protein
MNGSRKWAGAKPGLLPRHLFPWRLPVLLSVPLRRLLLAMLASLVLSVVVSPPAALADGATSIAGAPLVVYGQQQFGNTATGGIDRADDCAWRYSSNWLLPVVAGDQVTIDWQAQGIATQLAVLPLGTNDFNVGGTAPTAQDALSAGGRGEVVFTASATGSLPLVFRSRSGGIFCYTGNDTGPYDFTAYVRHVVRLGLPVVSSVLRKGTVDVGVHNAEGGPISDPSLLVEVQLKTGKVWSSVGRAPAVNGVARVPLNIPRHDVGLSFGLRAIAHGASYLDAASSSQRVLIAMRAKPKARARHRRRHQRRRSNRKGGR